MMNQEDIFKKIGHILNELSDQYQYLAQNPEELNELELELFLANASFLTDHVQIIRKLNGTTLQKALPEPDEQVLALPAQQQEEEEEVLPETEVLFPDEPAPSVKPIVEQEIFKLDNEISTFEFILNEKPSSDRFEFEEKSIGEIFDRPLSKEEEQIIAQKQKLREKDSLETELPEEDEIGPEPFLVSAQPEEEDIAEAEPLQTEVLAPQEVEMTSREEFIFNEQEEPPAKPSVVPEETERSVFTEPYPVADRQPPEKPVFSPVAAQTEINDGVKNGLFPDEKVKEETPAAKLTLNDILSGNTQNNGVRTESNRPVITDLKQAISLNEKLRYIRDLFNGYNLAYAEAIDLLNKMPDFKTADAFLQNNYAAKHNWADKQETVDQFYELLNQRFPAK